MSRRATVKPEWLDHMLVSWGKELNRSRGWYTVTPMLRDGIPMPAQSMEPTGLCRQDWRQLELAIEQMERWHQAAVIRAYRPWVAETLEREYPVPAKQWFLWLHEAAADLCLRMERMAA